MDIMRRCGNKKKKTKSMETSEFSGSKWTGKEILICFCFDLKEEGECWGYLIQ